MKPLVIDLFCGLGGWSEGFLSAGYRCVGFDIERHRYPISQAIWQSSQQQYHEYPGELVLQDVLTLDGRQLRNATCIVASPPCQEFSYMAMPWKRAKQIAAALRDERHFPLDYKGSSDRCELTALFDACFRIQREACEAAGRHIPLIVENVKGAQPWVGPAKANYGSFYLWGDIGMANGNIVLPGNLKPGAFLRVPARAGAKVPGMSWSGSDLPGYKAVAFNGEAERRIREDGRKVPGMNFHEFEKTGKPGRSFQSAAVKMTAAGEGETYGGGSGWDGSAMRTGNSKSPARKAASAQIAKIPFALSYWIAEQLSHKHQEAVA